MNGAAARCMLWLSLLGASLLAIRNLYSLYYLRSYLLEATIIPLVGARALSAWILALWPAFLCIVASILDRPLSHSTLGIITMIANVIYITTLVWSWLYIHHLFHIHLGAR
jgi:hypothetical protein